MGVIDNIRDALRAWNRDERGNRRIWWHWSNENDHGPPTHGRAWLHVGDATFCVEWTSWSGAGPGASVGVTDEPHLGGSVSLGPALYLWVEHALVYRLLRLTRGPREVSLRAHHGAVWWRLWRDPMGSWSRSVPRWREGNFGVVDAVLGREAVERRTVASERVAIPMPEGDYPADVALEEVTWRRPRLSWLPKRATIANVRLVERAVPHAGKGTESYNCGDDATYSMSMPAASVNDAIVKFIASSLKTRVRYGGRGDLRWTRGAPEIRPRSNGAETPMEAN